MEKTIHRMFSVSEIISFELVVLNTQFCRERILVIDSQYVNKQSEDSRYYKDRMFRTKVLFEWLKSMKNYFWAELGSVSEAFKMLTVHKCCDSGLFMHLINHAVSSILFHKYVSYESYLLFQNVQDLISSSEMQKKIQKNLLVFKIIAFNSLRWTVTFTERILVIGI